MKLISIKDAEMIWKTRPYVFAPDLMIAGERSNINRSFQGLGNTGPLISRINYTNTAKDLYEQEMAKVSIFDNMEPNDIFRYDYDHYPEFRDRLNENMRTPEMRQMLLRIVDMILADELEIGRYDANGNIIFTNFTDIC